MTPDIRQVSPLEAGLVSDVLFEAAHWRQLFKENGLEVMACDNRCWEILGGLTVKRWCELGNSGNEALQAIHDRLTATPADWLSKLEITRDADGGFRIPVRTLLILGRKSAELHG